jgi:branched-chain amino acid transport system ATP-binding protein
VTLLTLESVSKRFGGVSAVKDVSLTLEQGEILGIMGPTAPEKRPCSIL